MKFFPAFDDFMIRSVAAIPGTWERLRYVAGLRQSDGGYAHWGMTRTYGADVAQRTMRSAHEEVLRDVLRTPLSDLLDEVSTEPESRHAVPSPSLAPAGASASYGLHFAWLCESLRAIVTARKTARRAA